MILFNDFKAEPPNLRLAMLEAVERVISSGWYVLGPEVERFEAQWAKRCGVEFGIGVANGMDALEIGFRALGIGPGDEVVTTAVTAFATVLAIQRAGATPVLADIDPKSALLSIDSVKQVITPRTKAIVLVHLYGRIAEIASWIELCRQRDIHLVEDCAQAHGASWRGQPAGGFGVFGAYSFYPTKNLGTIGDGGMIVTKDAELAQRAKRIRNYGQENRYVHTYRGMNSRLDEIHAAILHERLKFLDQFVARRQEIGVRYDSEIANPLLRVLSGSVDSGAHAYHLYVLCCSRRDELLEYLNKSRIQSLIHYPIPIHHQPAFIDSFPAASNLSGNPELSHMRSKVEHVPLLFAEEHSKTCISIPCHPQLTDADIERVVMALNGFR